MAAGECQTHSQLNLRSTSVLDWKAESSLTQNQASTQLNHIRVPTKRTSNLSISLNWQSFKADPLSCDSCVGYLNRTNKLIILATVLPRHIIHVTHHILTLFTLNLPHLPRFPKFPVPQPLRKKTPRAVWFVASCFRRLKMEVCYHGILRQQRKNIDSFRHLSQKYLSSHWDWTARCIPTQKLA